MALTELTLSYVTEDHEGADTQTIRTEHSVVGEEAESVAYIMTAWRQFLESIGANMRLTVGGPPGRRQYIFEQVT